MPYTPLQTMYATMFLARLKHVGELPDRDKRRRFRQADSDTATAAFYEQFGIQLDTPVSAMIPLARWITNPQAHVYVPDFASVRFAQCVVGQSLHLRCGRPLRDPRHITPVLPALADLGTPVVVHADDLGAERGLKP